jgi:hypothetical protein
MDGLVYGYNYDSSKKLLKKDKQLKVEGVLDRVTIDVLESGKVIKTTETNQSGLFQIRIKTGKAYTLQLSKQGYSSITLVIDLTSIPKEIASRGISFRGAELILNSFQSKSSPSENLPFGKLFYNTEKNYLDFETAKFLSKKQRGSIDNPVSLMKRSVQKNRNNLNDLPAETVSPQKKETKKDPAPTEIVMPVQIKDPYDTLTKVLSELKLRAINSEKLSAADLQIIETQIHEARIQFEKDKLAANSDEERLILQQREIALRSLEIELKEAKMLIESQKKEIATQRLPVSAFTDDLQVYQTKEENIYLTKGKEQEDHRQYQLCLEDTGIDTPFRY